MSAHNPLTTHRVPWLAVLLPGLVLFAGSLGLNAYAYFEAERLHELTRIEGQASVDRVTYASFQGARQRRRVGPRGERAAGACACVL